MDQNSKRNIINLDSDSDSDFKETNQSFHKNKSQKLRENHTPKTETIDLLSDTNDEKNNDIIVIEDAAINNQEPMLNQTKISKEPADETKLTPQQLMRMKAADAAERRLKQAKKKAEEKIETKVDNFSKDNNNYHVKAVNIETLKLKHEDNENHKINILNNTTNNKKRKSKSLSPYLNQTSSRIRMISNPGYCSDFNVTGDTDTVSLHQLIGSTDLIKTYQFNMLIDFDYLSKFVRSKDCEFVLINKGEEHLNISDASWENYKIHTVDMSLKLPPRGTHHSKIMVNFFRDGSCQIVIHTMNLIDSDHILRTQMCWISPILKMHTDKSKYLDFTDNNLTLQNDTGTAFKRDFIGYLYSYENNDINKLIDSLGKYDFTPIDVVFIGSSPGHYEYRDKSLLNKKNAKSIFGYGRLWQVIHMLNLQSLSGKLVGQASSIAGPCDDWKRNELVHVLTSCVEKGYPLPKKSNYIYNNQKFCVEPILIWPTVKEVLKSRVGPLAGSALCFTAEGKWPAYKRQYDEIKRYFHKWASKPANESKSGRSNLVPHVKTYTLSENNFRTLKWMLLTSANVSRQAWGKPNFKSKEYSVIQYDISSFEAGVFIDPSLLRIDSNTENRQQVLVPTFGKDTLTQEESQSLGNTIKIGIRLPYDTPLERYKEDDQAWTQDDAAKYANDIYI